jgi:hypothetical protein
MPDSEWHISIRKNASLYADRHTNASAQPEQNDWNKSGQWLIAYWRFCADATRDCHAPEDQAFYRDAADRLARHVRVMLLERK